MGSVQVFAEGLGGRLFVTGSPPQLQSPWVPSARHGDSILGTPDRASVHATDAKPAKLLTRRDVDEAEGSLPAAIDPAAGPARAHDDVSSSPADHHRFVVFERTGRCHAGAVPQSALEESDCRGALDIGAPRLRGGRLALGDERDRRACREQEQGEEGRTHEPACLATCVPPKAGGEEPHDVVRATRRCGTSSRAWAWVPFIRNGATAAVASPARAPKTRRW